MTVRGTVAARALQTHDEASMSEHDETKTWPELAIGLFDALTGRGAEITYEFEDMTVMVPSKAGEGAEHAPWKLNGTIKIRTRDDAHGGGQ